eukprot:scaffold114808_cov67-Phaeocystis_antarctica.AAC.3
MSRGVLWRECGCIRVAGPVSLVSAQCTLALWCARTRAGGRRVRTTQLLKLAQRNTPDAILILTSGERIKLEDVALQAARSASWLLRADAPTGHEWRLMTESTYQLLLRGMLKPGATVPEMIYTLGSVAALGQALSAARPGSESGPFVPALRSRITVGATRRRTTHARKPGCATSPARSDCTLARPPSTGAPAHCVTFT